MTLLETIQYFLTETAADMDGLSWEIREETNYTENNIDYLTECYDFEKQLYDNLKQIKLMIEEKDPVKQIINDPNDELIKKFVEKKKEVDELIEKALKWTDKVLDGVDLNEKLPDENK
jgi:hypothetical protein